MEVRAGALPGSTMPDSVLCPLQPQGSHRDKRVKTSSLPVDPLDEPLQRKCDQLVKSLMKRSQGVHFLRPLEWKKMGLVDYPKLIKEPMDLGTVAERVGKSYYTRLEQFANDIRLVWVWNSGMGFLFHLATSTHEDSVRVRRRRKTRLSLTRLTPSISKLLRRCPTSLKSGRLP